jgi:hypothetical protein
MDRLKRTWMGCGLAVTMLLYSGGCRSMRPEVPPGKPYVPEAQGGSNPPIGFSNAPHASTGMPGTGLGAGTGNGIPGVNSGAGQLGTPMPSNGLYGAPTGNSFGPPGSSTSLAPGATMPGGAANPMTGIPQSGIGTTGPANGVGTPGLSIPGMP